jgi:hypothetical protein
MTIEYDHHSPSSLNLFAAAPAMWVAEKILGEKRPASATMHRGTATEAGVAHGLKDLKADLPDCIKVAQGKYDALMALSPDARKQAYRSDISPMVMAGLKALRPYGEPSDAQGKVEWKPDELKFPIMGFFDFKWSHKGALVEFKTTDKMPSKIKFPHARQAAFYTSSDNLDTRLTYVTPKKCETYQLENVREHRQALVNIALTVERFLSKSDDPQFFVDHTIPDLDSFYWNAPAARQMAYKFWRV